MEPARDRAPELAVRVTHGQHVEDLVAGRYPATPPQRLVAIHVTKSPAKDAWRANAVGYCSVSA
jgi:hypothetical protein